MRRMTCLDYFEAPVLRPVHRGRSARRGHSGRRWQPSGVLSCMMSMAMAPLPPAWVASRPVANALSRRRPAQRLDTEVAEQELDLLQVAVGVAAELGTGTPHFLRPATLDPNVPSAVCQADDAVFDPDRNGTVRFRPPSSWRSAILHRFPHNWRLLSTGRPVPSSKRRSRPTGRGPRSRHRAVTHALTLHFCGSELPRPGPLPCPYDDR